MLAAVTAIGLCGCAGDDGAAPTDSTKSTEKSSADQKTKEKRAE